MGLKENAAYILNSAYVQASAEPNFVCVHKDFIDYVIDNTHLTYKYILFTAILSKAADESINPLCLQKQSELPGAYDARTVCHKVIVPFEMEILKKAIGGSNEPFLNKPARFPELSKTNAVRRGNDQAILNALCDNLPNIKTSGEAYECLIYLLCKLIKIRDEKKRLIIFSIKDSVNLPSKLMQFVNEALKSSYEGEVLTLMVAGIYHLMYLHNPDVNVEVHPVNESGASNNEISDLDIYINGKLISSNELKDKIYAETDVRHAADKVMNAGGNRMLFIEGPRGYSDDDFIESIQNEYISKNFMLRILSYRFFFSTMISSLKTIDCEEFVRFILQTAQDTKFKGETIAYLHSLAERIFGLKH
ncbi:MAG: restriction endonuclease, SacI family [Synergistaceae bacterium]|nr:restriction endonuclease, SacI family [Synergistaceae bacterium]